jgi:translation initiation factor IF-2
VGEAGGITQHIGAYQIEYKGKKLTFLDTPGHAAFEKMRERGACMTDIAVLIVAADDGFMPQTDEALKHCRKTAVPIVVAINKMDVKGADAERVKKQMQQRNLLPEEWGGDVITVPISALTGDRVNDLLDMLLLQSEIMELKANPKCGAEGVIVESKIEQGRGPVATVIVQKGTLKAGDAIVCGGTYCKVRSLLNERDEKLSSAPPSTPARVIGWSEAPEVGAHFTSAKNEKDARAEAEETAQKSRLADLAAAQSAMPSNITELLASMDAQQSKTLSVLVKADVKGSLEAVQDSLNAIKSDKVKLNIVGGSVGLINPSDVELAHSTHSIIVAFNTRSENGVAALLKHDQVGIISHNIIYELVNQVREAMAELLDPIPQEISLGKAEIRQVFNLSKGTIAGCMVTSGSIFRDRLARLWRADKEVATGKVSHLKRMKDDASEVKSGYECGIALSGAANDFKEGDIIECYEIQMVKQSL